MCEERFNALKWATVCLSWKEQKSPINSCSQVTVHGAYEIARIFEHGFSHVSASFSPFRPILVTREEGLGCMQADLWADFCARCFPLHF